MYLLLNFIPVVGTVIFLVLQGRKFGPQAHARYFQLKKMSNHRQREFVEQRRGAYTRYILRTRSGNRLLTLWLQLRHHSNDT
jgi:hypothetical protein